MKKLAEEARVSVRNERRDAIKHVEQRVKDKDSAVSEDQGKVMKENVEELTREHIQKLDALSQKKAVEVQEL